MVCVFSVCFFSILIVFCMSLYENVEAIARDSGSHVSLYSGFCLWSFVDRKSSVAGRPRPIATEQRASQT